VSSIEVEVKIRIHDRAALGTRLEDLGARLLHPREFEDNLLYDFPDRRLTERGSILRIRILDRAAILTFKSPGGVSLGAKVRHEIESALPASEADSLTAIIRAIGLVPVFRYQKYRTTWEVPGLLITLDETPIGDYMELEGEQPLIVSVAARLGYQPDAFITSSYRELHLASPASQSESADQMVFTA